MIKFKEFLAESVKVTMKKVDKSIDKIETYINNDKYSVEVEFYGGEGVDPLFSIEPIPEKEVIDGVEEILQKDFKKFRVNTTILNDYVSFRIR